MFKTIDQQKKYFIKNTLIIKLEKTDLRKKISEQRRRFHKPKKKKEIKEIKENTI